MRLHLFGTGILIIIAGLAATPFIPKMPGFEFIRGALTLGGALLICGLFEVKNHWHGLIGAGVVSLLGAAKGIMGIKALPDFIMGDRSRGIAPLVETGIMLLCVVLLLRIVNLLKAERTRRMLEADP